MRNVWIKKGFPFVLACTMIALPLLAPAAAAADISGIKANAQQAKIDTKTEVVYGVLSADGTVNSVYTVNRLELDEPGEFTDYGAYAAVTNLTNTDSLTLNGDAVTGSGTTGDFYYQGDMENTDLPWMFDLIYTLDDVPIHASDLAGKSGALTIRLKTKENPVVNNVFYDNYMLQITFTLDMNLCRDISADGGTISEAGTNKIITFTVLPGKTADLTLTANVENFSMAGIDIAAIPYAANMESPDTTAFTGSFQQLHDGIAQLHDGVGSLSAGTDALCSGGKDLQESSSTIKNSLEQLAGNADPLLSGSAQIEAALRNIAAGLESGLSQYENITLFEQLPAGLSGIAEGLRQLSDGLAALTQGISPAYSALNAAMEKIPASTLAQEELAALYPQVDTEQQAILDTLINTYTAAQAAKGTYLQVKSTFDAVVTNLTSVAKELSNIADSLDTIVEKTENLSGMLSPIQELAGGIAALSESYTVFQQGLADYTNGVTQLSSGYADFDSGLSSVMQGITALQTGVEALDNGTGALRDKTAGMADEADTAIQSMLAEYLGNDFQMISFTSEKNSNVSLVQFVLKFDGISMVQKETSTTPEEKTETFFDRFIALFTKKEN